MNFKKILKEYQDRSVEGYDFDRIDTSRVTSEEHLFSILSDEIFFNNTHHVLKLSPILGENLLFPTMKEVGNQIWVYMPTLNVAHDDIGNIGKYTNLLKKYHSHSKNKKKELVLDARNNMSFGIVFIKIFTPFLISSKIKILKSESLLLKDFKNREFTLSPYEPYFLNDFSNFSNFTSNPAFGNITLLINKKTGKINNIFTIATIIGLYNSGIKIYSNDELTGYVANLYPINIDKEFQLCNKTSAYCVDTLLGFPNLQKLPSGYLSKV